MAGWNKLPVIDRLTEEIPQVGAGPTGLEVKPRAGLDWAMQFDIAATRLRNAAQEYTDGEGIRTHALWEELRDAALELARVHDPYRLAEYTLGGDTLVGRFVRIPYPFMQYGPLGRIGTGCFEFWCGAHETNLAPNVGFSPSLKLEAEAGVWFFDLSEVRCPQEPQEGNSCSPTWACLEVIDPTLEVPRDEEVQDGLFEEQGS